MWGGGGETDQGKPEGKPHNSEQDPRDQAVTSTPTLTIPRSYGQNLQETRKGPLRMSRPAAIKQRKIGSKTGQRDA